jgi:hypothetical protein
MVAILIVLNNYLHDVATALLLSSAVVLYVLGRQAKRGGEGERRAFAHAYKTLTYFAWGALAWIIIGGIPRTIFFPTYEFIPAEMKGIVLELIIKHVLLVSAVIAGAVMWVRLGRFAREIAAGDECSVAAGEDAR